MIDSSILFDFNKTSSMNVINEYQAFYSCSNSDNNGTSNNNDLNIIPFDERQKVLDKTDDILKIFQNLDIDLRTKKNNNILIIQNVNVIENENEIIDIESTNLENDPYKIIFNEIIRIGGLKNFMIKLIKKSVEFCDKNRTNAAKELGISVRTIRNYLNSK